jgi:hypothetical protein
LKQRLRVAILLSITCAAVAAFSNLAQAQKIDVGFGVSTVLAPSASSCSGNCQIPQSLGGGAFPGFSGDVLFWHNLGVGAEAFWRGSQGSGAYADEQGVNYRPVFYNFNGVYSPKLASHAYLELVAGVGAMSTRLYACEEGNSCGIAGGNTAVASSRHFDADFGGGIKLYVLHGLFVRPEARFYWINNDTNFSGSYATRVGASIGYTFGGH